MYDVIRVAYTIIKRYYDKMNVNPSAYVLQKLLYFIQVRYMRRNNYERLFNENFACSIGGPCILKVEDEFIKIGTIPIELNIKQQTEMEKSLIKDESVLVIIDSVINDLYPYFGNPLEISDKITLNCNSAWFKQKDQDNIVNRQPIENSFLIEEAKGEDILK